MINENDEDNTLILVCLLLLLVDSYNKCRERHFLTRSAICSPQHSPWMRLFNYGDDPSFLELTGMTRNVFLTLENILFPVRRVNGRGRPRLLNNFGELGLILFYLNSTMKLKHLCSLFGITPSSASRIISTMLKRIIKYLYHNNDAKVIFPDNATKARFAEMVQRREPTLNNIIGFIDGLSLAVECSDNQTEQKKMYNGYKGDTCCNNVFAFSPEGKIFAASINCPGSWHDSNVARPIIAKVIESIGDYAICVDQGFPRSGELFGKFVGPLTESRRLHLDPSLRDHLIARHNKYVSLRQASEWGMRALQGSFSRLKSRLPSDQVKRQRIIYSIILLHNFRTHHVGLNQIATVFNPLYQQYVNVDGYDKIRKYFA